MSLQARKWSFSWQLINEIIQKARASRVNKGCFAPLTPLPSGKLFTLVLPLVSHLQLGKGDPLHTHTPLIVYVDCCGAVEWFNGAQVVGLVQPRPLEWWTPQCRVPEHTFHYSATTTGCLRCWKNKARRVNRGSGTQGHGFTFSIGCCCLFHLQSRNDVCTLPILSLLWVINSVLISVLLDWSFHFRNLGLVPIF